MTLLGQLLNLLSSILTILLTCPNNDTSMCYSNNPLTVKVLIHELRDTSSIQSGVLLHGFWLSNSTWGHCYVMWSHIYLVHRCTPFRIHEYLWLQSSEIGKQTLQLHKFLIQSEIVQYHPSTESTCLFKCLLYTDQGERQHIAYLPGPQSFWVPQMEVWVE